MAKEYTEIDARIQRWIDQQKMFFVSTAPLSSDGLVNCSPKGLHSFCTLSPTRIAYVDVGGSGIETVAHIKENARIVVMMCAFSGPPMIYRFYGKGSVVEPHEDNFDDLLANFPPQPAARNIVIIDIERIIDSCGYGVPLYEFKKHRDSMQNYYASKTPEEIATSRARNHKSLEGLPGLTPPT